MPRFSIFSSIYFLRAMSSRPNCKSWLSVLIYDIISLFSRFLSISKTSSLCLLTSSDEVLVSTLSSSSSCLSSKGTGCTGDKSSRNLLSKVVDESWSCKGLSIALDYFRRSFPKIFKKSIESKFNSATTTLPSIITCFSVNCSNRF